MTDLTERDLTSPDLTDGELAHLLAQAAGAGLLALRQGRPDTDGKALGDEGDESANVVLLEALARHRPTDAVFSEETKDDVAGRRAADRVWIIDPLDGTREYGERRHDWGVHVALWDRAHGLVAGAVALPSQEVTLSTVGVSQRPVTTGRGPLLVVSRTRPPAWVPQAAEAIGGRLEPMGSVGAKVASIVLGHTDAYVTVGAMGEWDTAAPVAVALAAGLHATRLDGSPVQFNTEDGRTHDLLVCRPELADTLLETCARLRADEGNS
jgi:3'(2'), 5'-bisphosphate nucleotidase